MQRATLGELEIQLGDREELRIEADDNLLQDFEVEKTSDTLIIGTPDGTWLWPSQTVRYTLTVRELEFIGLSSVGNADGPTLSANRFKIRVSSSGDISMEGPEANALDLSISSSGNVMIDDGSVDEQVIRITSSGSYDGARVGSYRVVARLSSSGTARVWVEESIEARFSSSGSVLSSGDPEVFDSRSSSGRVRRIR